MLWHRIQAKETRVVCHRSWTPIAVMKLKIDRYPQIFAHQFSSQTHRRRLWYMILAIEFGPGLTPSEHKISANQHCCSLDEVKMRKINKCYFSKRTRGHSLACIITYFPLFRDITPFWITLCPKSRSQKTFFRGVKVLRLNLGCSTHGQLMGRTVEIYVYQWIPMATRQYKSEHRQNMDEKRWRSSSIA